MKSHFAKISAAGALAALLAAPGQIHAQDKDARRQHLRSHARRACEHHDGAELT